MIKRAVLYFTHCGEFGLREYELVRIFVVQEQLNMIFGFCTVLYGGLLGYETVSTGSFDACAVRY